MFPVAVTTEKQCEPMKDEDRAWAQKQADDARAALAREIPDFIEQINAIAHSNAPVNASITRLRALADRVSSAVRPYSPCASGCSACCHQAVIIPPQEAMYIGKQIKREAQQPKKWVHSKAQANIEAEHIFGNPCPFLKNSKCSIYAHRPLACRTHINMAPDASTCATDKVRETACLDLRIFDDALLYVCRALPADIRDYFPPTEKRTANA